MDSYINFETYCPPDFIFKSKKQFFFDKKNNEIWTQDDLDLINFRRNHYTSSKIKAYFSGRAAE